MYGCNIGFLIPVWKVFMNVFYGEVYIKYYRMSVFSVTFFGVWYGIMINKAFSDLKIVRIWFRTSHRGINMIQHSKSRNICNYIWLHSTVFSNVSWFWVLNHINSHRGINVNHGSNVILHSKPQNKCKYSNIVFALILWFSVLNHINFLDLYQFLGEIFK
jgi:WD40 repeat protein